MSDSTSWEPIAGRSSFVATNTRMSVQEWQQQRQADLEAAEYSATRLSRTSYVVNHSHETDFLMSSIVATPASPEPGSPVPERIATTSSGRQSPASPRAAIGNMLDVSSRRGASSLVDVEDIQTFLDQLPSLTQAKKPQQSGYGAVDSFNEVDDEADEKDDNYDVVSQDIKASCWMSFHKCSSQLEQIPAITIAALLNLMLAIPFGVAYFPIGWSGGGDNPEEKGADDVSGPFPLPGKEQLGIRMCLFSTLVGQIAMTFASKFTNGLCYQQIESVPFFHSLAYIAISQQGYGMETLSTVFFLFGLSSIITGVFFYALGAFDLGRLVYFFPNHVLVGCIGGIGVFITRTAVEVTNDAALTFDRQGLQTIVDKFNLLAVVLSFEATLRILIWKTKGRIPLLAPIFFCFIPVVFYAGMWICGVDKEMAEEAGYFFPSPSGGGRDDNDNTGSPGNFLRSSLNSHTFDLLKVIDFRTVSWKAVLQSSGTLVALAAFSLIHVPINIPAFSISIDVDTDMNNELMAHGYSNFASGIFGGLPNYMTYSNSLLYAKSKGNGKVSSLLVALTTFILFIFGPTLATFIPRCMASVLLLHVGVDLILEGVVDSYHDYDNLEYTGIWAITIVMTVFGMTAALIAGVIAALSVYAAQSITRSNPIREILSAKTLRSSVWTRPAAELAILNDDKIGRSRILVIQLHGHLFFGNVNQLTEAVQEMLSGRQGTDLAPLIVILDFSLVIGLDSSAAHSIAKMNSNMHRRFNVAGTVFVTPPDDFSCEGTLSKALQKHPCGDSGNRELDTRLNESLASIGHSLHQRNRVCNNLDDALIFAEDVLIILQDPSLLIRDRTIIQPTGWLSAEDERRLGAQQLANLFPASDEISNGIQILFSHFVREEYKANDIIWEEGADSDCAKLLVRGELIAYTQGGANTSTATERVPTGNIVGELGLVQGSQRLSTLECVSDKAVLYNLSSESWNKVKREHPAAAICLEEVVIRYLSSRVQHVGRIFETRCLPV